MLLLAIDSATPVAGAALREDERLLGAAAVNSGQRHSAQLMPLVDQVLRQAGRAVTELDAIAVSVGPGSFTGLRVGMAAAKGLCLALDKPLLGVSTLKMLAHNLSGSDALVCPVIYARKQEIYTAFYDCAGEEPRPLSAEMAIPPAELPALAAEMLRSGNYATLLLPGDGYDLVRSQWPETDTPPLTRPAEELCAPRPAALAELAWRQARAGEYLDYRAARPVYLRLSEAEYQLGKGEV